MNFFLPGSVILARFTSTVESTTREWTPPEDTMLPTVAAGDPIDLTGAGFSVGRSTTGTYLDLYYSGLDENDIQARKAFMEQYLGWPVVVGGEFGAFLQEVQAEAPDRSRQIFGNLQVYLRLDFDGTSATTNLSEAPFTYSTFVALQSRMTLDGVEFPAVGEEPQVMVPASMSSMTRNLRVSHHELTDAVRSPDDPQTILIQSTEAIEGYMPVSGELPISTGATAMIGPGDPDDPMPEKRPRKFTLERLVRRSAVQMEARFERIIT